MATGRMDEVLHYLRLTVAQPDGAATDGQLLEGYLARRDGAALAALVRRHGPMVWGVCRRVLRDRHDAEDAFQATFLVLVRRAASISSPELLANWLHGVARRTALKARAAAARRAARERQVAQMPQPEAAEPDPWPELRPLLDEELGRLPEKYSALVVLCDLEGKTRKEVARQLGCPEGTVAGRLARARAMLAARLARRGVVPCGAALAAAFSVEAASACVPASLASCTIRAATLVAAGRPAAGLISAQAAALTEGATEAMSMKKVTAVAAILLAAAALSGAAGLAYRGQTAERPQAQRAVAQKPARKGQPAGKARKPRPDIERLQGEWEIVSTVEDGQELKGGDREVGAWAFKGGTVRIKSRRKHGKSGEATGFLRFRLDEKADPRRIDCVEGKAADLFDLAEWDKRLADADERREGIYRIDGDTLKVCISHKKGDRPAAFQSKKGSDHMLVVLKRKAAKQDEKKQEQKKQEQKETDAFADCLRRAGIEMRDVDAFLLGEAVRTSARRWETFDDCLRRAGVEMRDVDVSILTDAVKAADYWP